MMNKTTMMNECIWQREHDGTDTARNREKGRVAEKGQKCSEDEQLGSHEGSRSVAF